MLIPKIETFDLTKPVTANTDGRTFLTSVNPFLQSSQKSFFTNSKIALTQRLMKISKKPPWYFYRPEGKSVMNSLEPNSIVEDILVL